jgi:hypothetical protein
MRLELASEGHDVQFVAVNSASAASADDQASLTDRCSFATLQNLDEVGAWTLMGGSKDDFYVYGADGKLFEYLPIGGEGPDSIVLSTDEGYAHVKDTILAAIAAAP